MYLSNLIQDVSKEQLEFNNKKSIYIAGHQGMLGTALKKVLQDQECENLIIRSSAELDLTRRELVEKFFETERPQYVILSAALVGGIQANIASPADFIHVNLAIQNNVIHAASLYGVEKLIFFGSGCMYPRDAEQPISEGTFLEGLPELTSLPYAVAKIAGTIQCAAYRAQYGLKANVVVPTSIYGPGDNFDTNNSHVLAALIRKFHDAKINRAKEIHIWGTGTPQREFVYVEDVAKAVFYLLKHYDSPEIINIGTGVEVSIGELAEIVSRIVGFTGKIVYQTDKPDGTSRKILDSAKIRELGWRPQVSLEEGILETYRWFQHSLQEY